MILDKEVNIKMNSKHISKYRDLGYICNVGEYSLISIEHLPRYSKCEINVSCDDCYEHNKILYINYTKKLEEQGRYRCFSCGKEKAKKTCVEKYGVDNPTKLKIFSDKISLNYNLKSDYEKESLKKKSKDNMFDKYGDWYRNTDEFKEKVIKTSMDNYGVIDYRSSDVFKNKVINSNLVKYGVKYPSQIPLRKRKALFGNKINGFHILSNLNYQGTYELDFLNKFYDKIIIDKIDSIKYKLYNNEHFYFPDFYLPEYNLIIEVKSTYTYNYDLDKNLAKKNRCEELGYNFLFIIDKNYDILMKN